MATREDLRQSVAMATRDNLVPGGGRWATWRYPINLQYQPYMVSLMSHFHGLLYASDHQFTRDDLLELTPTEVTQWMAEAAYGDFVYNPDVDRPIYARSASLEMRKKAVSFFMPNKSAWVVTLDGIGYGNPTMSREVNQLIAEVKRFEVRGEGSRSQVKRGFTKVEFRKMLEMLRRENDPRCRFMYHAMTVLQYNLIGRIDDICNFKMTDPRGHRQFDFALLTKVSWSKNVRDERRCPDQILLGSMNPFMCVILNMAIWMSVALALKEDCHWLFNDQPRGATPAESKQIVKNLIATYRNNVTNLVWNSDEFKALCDEDDRGKGK